MVPETLWQSTNVVLNTIVAEAFKEACDELEKVVNAYRNEKEKGENFVESEFNRALHDLIKRNASKHQRIIFSGNGYAEEWIEEAKRRGLPNIRSMVESIPALTVEKTISLFENFKVFTETELRSRAEIKYENYAKAINIESRTMIDMASKQIIPAVIKYTKSLADTVVSVREAGADCLVQAELLSQVSGFLSETKEALGKLMEVTEIASKMETGRVRAEYYYYEVTPVMGELRKPVDALEMIVDKEVWPMPSYGDLIFEV